MSVKTLYFPDFSSFAKPTEIPATGSLIGTPASINAIQAAQTEACDVDPFEETTSETILIVYGNFSTSGNIGNNAFSTKAPCPISLLLGPRIGAVSPDENGGKL